MKYENLQQALDALRTLQQTHAAYNHAMGVVYLDATTVAPSDSWEGRGKTMEILSKAVYDLTANPENGELFDYLQEHAEELDPQQKRELEVLKKGYDQMFKIPQELSGAKSLMHWIRWILTDSGLH